ncbi:MAG TPA: 23S rRNA (uracil(1939)-C(5))-methyltransferase RlmD [Betaproteobacteria bacterium]|nr:23S rRNA (uracil(1939)-C(5))-methyltransferase RlmD [Betaproteobacteria bacterium]
MLVVESLGQDGVGVAHANGKAVFIEGALPGETVAYQTYRRTPTYELAAVTGVMTPCFMRVTPRCPHFGRCGGCVIQHLEASAQVAMKQRVLEDALWRIGRVRADHLLPPIYGQSWGYRQRARLSVRYVPRKGGVLVGFHEKRSSFVTEMTQCAVLPPTVSALILPLRELIGQLSGCQGIPQVEIAVGDQVTALVLRILEPLEGKDELRLRQFCDRYGVQIFLQAKDPESAAPFYPLDAPPLTYALPEFDIVMPFHPTDFTQVNHAVNRMLVRRVVRLLAPAPGERIADCFCGLGNFSLPIARQGAQVTGIEGNPRIIRRAAANAAYNGLAERTTFVAADLFETNADFFASLGRFDKLLIGPPRDGAVALVKSLEDNAPDRIVYISCNPATLARDAAVLVNTKGYALTAAGVVNMFPHTRHVESIACFER